MKVLLSRFFVLLILLITSVFASCKSDQRKPGEESFCKANPTPLNDPKSALNYDTRSILSGSFDKYKRLETYEADVSVRSVSLTRAQYSFFRLFREEQQSQEFKLSYSKSSGSAVGWVTFKPRITNCSDFIFSSNRCKDDIWSHESHQWCAFIADSFNDIGDQETYLTGTLTSDRNGTAISYSDGSANQMLTFPDLPESLNWLERTGQSKIEISRLLVGDQFFSMLLNANIVNPVLVGIEAIDGRDCFVITGEKEKNSTLLNEASTNGGALKLIFWIQKDDLMIPRLEIRSETENNVIFWIEAHRIISYS